MTNSNLPDLTFPTIPYGKTKIPLDLRSLLYIGGAAANTRQINILIDKGALGPPIMKRLNLVKKIHSEINGELVGGGSSYTVIKILHVLRRLFTWAEESKFELDFDNIINTFKNWTDHLIQQHRVVGCISEMSAYNFASIIAKLLGKVLQQESSPLRQTRIRFPGRINTVLSTKADKQNLENTFKFGNFLLDFSDSLDVKAINGTLPVKIPLRSGEVLEDWSGLMNSQRLKPPKDQYQKDRSEKLRHAWEVNATGKNRYPVINLRIEVEMLIFISMTSMNMEQTHRLKHSRFHYTSHLDGYQVRQYKNRRSGIVEFHIFGEYKIVFERYLKWRNNMFPDDTNGLLFPLIRAKGRSEYTPPKLSRIQSYCKKCGIKFIGPRELRNTRVNWLLRHLNDPALTAEMAQHTKETLLGVYQRPSLQVAMIEISKFHSKTDPTICAPGPGVCISASPIAVSDIPKLATSPDCINASGCLFCTHHRDVDSEDHVWSLVSFRYLKSLELARYRPSQSNRESAIDQSSKISIDQLTSIIKFFEISSEIRRLWVLEAHARVSEGHYHPTWDGFIQLGGG